MAFNGDDSLQLYLGGTLQDTFGTCASDPGSDWNGGGVSTQNFNLQIQHGLCTSNTAGWTDPSTRFDQIAIGTDMIGFGNAPTSCCLSNTTWDGSTWSGGTPDLTTEAILNANYDTNANGSFQACSLTVSPGSTLTIGDGTFVEVENDLTVEATAFIYVASQGAFVQNNDAGLVTSSGTIEVTKTTAPLNNWYEYTYWSSPVANADIDNGLGEAKSNRRYSFNAQNFLDVTAETNNNNATVAGQDDIDDNGDDWFNVNGTTVMQPGVGYAAMHDPAGFSGPGSAPYQFDYIFSGPFNNGVISVPIYRNDSENNDINWNFIGNPYPSAIDADLFLAANSNISTSVAGSGYINGAIFLWSQNTLPSATTNGNEPLNFSNDDYSIINASGETTGGDGTTAATLSNSNRAISSGQGFFVAFSDGAIPISTTGDISEGVITFNNSMRVTDVAANSVFFKGTSSKNTNIADKLWINLTSEVGVYNQILIAYVNGATNEDDGLTFDATKHPANAGAALYSTIGDSNKKFAIQGKAVESINEEEIINLGFTNYINNEIPYTLSIDKLQGDFLNNNTVYLKDNLLNITHNLSDGNYNFTSETGAFTDRFEVVFKEENTLTVDDIINNESAFQIIQHDSDRVTFKTGTSATLKSIAIYDLFGRKVYQFKGENSSETFNIPNIKTGIYLAKAELSTGVIITKKAIKR
ncbi:T9SS type A sorting domain-containing protein [Algibacter lectus]|uniref:Secretion system C-terminal sorting domain-containing protein n=1 Tax=Algibacter lectus TaxID=221126 RepID=A0A090W3R3_9FLAO|nr:T9SS type A sorting domain-containing protein [Algibacter lectus]GAL62167.1 hypothetical protein JCM19300_2918 [Algibacter lectus]